jgi:RNA polymerase sigma factor (sigma-70 family)
MNDKQIIEHLQHNKYSLAIKGLYKNLGEIKQYIKANSGTADDAEDIFQDALVILYKKVHSPGFNLTVSLKTYLLAVAKNCWLQELRQRKKIPAGEVVTEPVDINTTEEPAFDFATAAFNLLGDKCRELLIQFYFKKKSYKEIAASLAFSDELVAKNQKYRCLQKAKENYKTLLNNGIYE